MLVINMNLDDKSQALRYNPQQSKPLEHDLLVKQVQKVLDPVLMKGSYYNSFPNMTYEKILADFCVRPQVVLSPKAKDRKLTEEYVSKS